MRQHKRHKKMQATRQKEQSAIFTDYVRVYIHFLYIQGWQKNMACFTIEPINFFFSLIFVYNIWQ